MKVEITHDGSTKLTIGKAYVTCKDKKVIDFIMICALERKIDREFMNKVNGFSDVGILEELQEDIPTFFEITNGIWDIEKQLEFYDEYLSPLLDEIYHLEVRIEGLQPSNHLWISSEPMVPKAKIIDIFTRKEWGF